MKRASSKAAHAGIRLCSPNLPAQSPSDWQSKRHWKRPACARYSSKRIGACLSVHADARLLDSQETRDGAKLTYRYLSSISLDNICPGSTLALIRANPSASG